MTRQKGNTDYIVVEERAVPDNRNIRKDELIRFNGYYAQKKYPRPLRRIELWDEEKKERIVFLTNHLTFGTTIATGLKANDTIYPQWSWIVGLHTHGWHER